MKFTLSQSRKILLPSLLLLMILGASMDQSVAHRINQLRGWFGTHSVTSSAQSTSLQTFQDTHPQDVSNAVVSAIAARLQSVSGLDELVVEPSSSSAGYTVSAEVDLGPNPNESKLSWSPKVASAAEAYFTNLFSGSEKIVNAQVYFILGGQVVASAGLGQAVYQHMEVSTSTMSDMSFVAILSHQPTMTSGGMKDSWFEEASN